MAETYKVLGQLAPAATVLGDLYVVPAAKSAVCSTVVVCNRNTVPDVFRLAICPVGAAIADPHWLAFDADIIENETISFTLGVGLQTTDVIRVRSGLGAVSFSALGCEVA